MESHKPRLQLLKDLGYTPAGILDIGANVGRWTELVHDIYPTTPILMVEGNTDHTDILNNKLKTINEKAPNSSVSIELLSDSKKEVIFYKASEGSTLGDSIYREKTSHYSNKNVIKETRITKTLDELTKNIDIIFDFIKLDVQGSEADVLKGGLNTISKANYLLIETQLMEYNANAPFIHEIISLANELDFRIADILQFHYLPDGRLNEVDILFSKKDNPNLILSSSENTVDLRHKYDICNNKISLRKIINRYVNKTI